MSSDDGFLVIGRIGRPHGTRGEVYVDLVTDRIERLDAGARLRCRDEWLRVERSRPVANRWLVFFEGVTDRESAARLTSIELRAAPLDDDPDALWVHELIGSQVFDVAGDDHGACVAVIHNPAADLLELESGALVPITFVVSAARGRVTIDPPEGLLDLFTDSV